MEQERALNQSTALSPASRWTPHFTVFHTKPHFTLCQCHTTLHSVYCSTHCWTPHCTLAAVGHHAVQFTLCSFSHSPFKFSLFHIHHLNFHFHSSSLYFQFSTFTCQISTFKQFILNHLTPETLMLFTYFSIKFLAKDANG